MYEKESKAVSYFLRHDTSVWRDKEGYMFIDQLISLMQVKFPNFNLQTLKQIVAEDEKQRYSYQASEIGMIRANQGHSVVVDLKLKAKIPPVTLYHGTDKRGILEIEMTGIQKMKRHAVHLTDDPTTAESVGMRHGSQVLIEIDTRGMVRDGVKFFQSDNGVWLTEFVDVKYISSIKTK